MAPTNAVREKRTSDLAALSPSTPAALVDIVERLTESNRERRPSSAEELLGSCTV